MLFSDIEGSTRLLQQLGADYPRVLLEHRDLMRAAFAEHDGDEQSTEGDSFFVTFPSASKAVAAALAAQRALAAHTWPPDGTVRVRIGVHVGEIQTVAGTIVGMSVHEGARIGAAAHGGQVLVSQAAADLTGALPDDTRWRDLGEHRLKDIAEPMHLLQLDQPGLPTEFPSPRSQSSGRNNLPAQTSAFIGRDDEVAEVNELLRATRLLTLTGAGGAGKSRLALRAAADQGGVFSDGVWFVDLAPITDPAAVPAQFAAGLSLAPEAAADLVGAVGTRTLLALVDNCEHLVAAVCETVDALLRGCPNVTVLATSREPLGVHGEVSWRVPSLAGDDAIELFAARGRAVNPRFDVTDDNRDTVRDLCARLDAIPLALELAAARLGSLTVEQLAARLDQRFRLLAGGARSAMARQRTLQATVDWSYDLLDETAQRVLRRLGVFVGGFTLEAAEAVCAEDGVDVFDVLDQLVNKSLVVAEAREGAVRYRLLETIRQYALDRLVHAGETEAARDAHLAWARQLATDAESSTWFGGADALAWLDRLDNDDANLRAAIEWATEGARLSDATELVMQLFGWVLARGRIRESLDQVQRLLALPVQPGERAMLAFAEHVLSSNVGPDVLENVERRASDITAMPESTRPWLQPCADGYITSGRVGLGAMTPADGLPLVEAAVAAARRDGHLMVIGMTLQALIWVRSAAGDSDGAYAAAQEALQLTIDGQLAVGESRTGLMLAQLALQRGDPDAAWSFAEQGISAAQRTRDPRMTSAGFQVLAFLQGKRGSRRAAIDMLLAAIDLAADIHSDETQAQAHNEIAWFAFLEGDGALASLHAEHALSLFDTSRPAATAALHTAGEIARLRGDLDTAWHHLRDAAALAAGDAPFAVVYRPSILRGLAGVRLDEGAPADAALLLGAGAAKECAEAEGDDYAVMVTSTLNAARSALDDAVFAAQYDAGAALDFDAAIAAADTMRR
jgi:predicted ATPase/class 3 adenylate cyclase